MPTVAKLMTHHADCVAPSTRIADAAALMANSRISSVVVIEQELIVGIVTERDILQAMHAHRASSESVAAIMTSPVHTVGKEIEFRDAYREAARLGIRHLVIADAAGKPLGVVTETDFRRHVGLDLLRQLNTIDTLMEHEFSRLPTDATLDEAIALMERTRHSCVIVVEGELARGIITERDIVRLFPHSPGSTLLNAVMSQPVASIDIEKPLGEAARLMLENNFRHLAVVDRDQRLLGLLTEHCLVRPLELDLLDDALTDCINYSDAKSKAERAVSTRERYQRALLDNFPFLVWLKDTESRFLAVNQQMADAAGAGSIEAMPGHTDFDYFPHDLAAQYRDDDFDVMASGVKSSVIEEIVTRKGRTWHETYKAPVLDDDGTMLGTVGFARDISERKRAEYALVVRNAALAGLLRGEQLEGVLELVALSAEAELPGILCSILLISDDRLHLRMGAAPSLDDESRDALDGMAIEEGVGASGTAAFRKQRVVVEDIFNDPNGQRFHDFARRSGVTSAWAEPIFSSSGELLGTFAAYHTHKSPASSEQHEVLRQASQLAALVISHERNARSLDASLGTFQGIFESVDEALLIADFSGRYLAVNIRAEELTGYSRKQLIGKNYGKLLVDRDRELTNSHIRATLAGTPQVLEDLAKDAQGRIFPVEIRMRPAKYFGKDVVIASARDISESKAAAQRLKVERDLAEALANGKTRQELAPVLLHIALRLPEFDSGGFYWRTPDGAYQLSAHHGLSKAFVDAVGHYDANTPQARFMEAGQILCNSSIEHSDFNDLSSINSNLLAQEDLRNVALLPIVVAGQTVGCLNLASHTSDQISNSTFTALQGLAPNFAQTLLRVDAQNEAWQLQQNLSGLFDTLQDFLFILDPQGLILHCNKAVIELLGYELKALLGRPITEVHPPESRQFAMEIVAEMVAGTRSSCPLPLLRADGSRLMVETRVAFGHWNGEPAIFGISQDISERLLAEERQKLAASVFDNAHEGIMITNPKGRIIDVNETFTELTGYSREETLGQTADMLKSGHHSAEFYDEMWQTISNAGYWRGEVWNRKKSGEIFVEQLTISTVRDRLGAVSHFVGIFSDITVIKEHQQRLEHLAHFDALTQLPNRMLLSDRMQLAMAQTERNQELLAVCYLDLDGFKPVNDDYGHAVGDRLLIEVAQRLKACMRGGDTVSRLGGDEFVLLISGLDNIHECDQAIARVISTLNQPYRINEQNITISASIGVTLYPEDAADSDTLLRHADQAMYAAKQAGRNRHHLFDPENDRRARVRREEIDGIRQGLTRGEFMLYYQPKVNMRTGAVIGAEALIRWQHPERGLLLPAHFLHAIEGGELAIEIGDWVIQQALCQLANWGAQGLELSVSINIAGNHLQHPNFTERLGELLAAWPQVPPERLELEVLETAALDDMTYVANLFTECRKLGVRFALDDFGTGYSSLTYFRRLPADVLKIDQSFVRDMLDDPEDMAIVEGVIGLTQAFKRNVIAEGVETVEHGLALLLLGCDLAQGYGIAHPMPPQLVADWVADFQPDELWGSTAAFNWSRDDIPMLIAGVDHARWIKTLLACLDTSDDTLAPPELDETACRFGRWYESPAAQRYATLNDFMAMDRVHRQIHQLGSELLAKKDSLTADLLQEKRQRLTELSETLVDHLQKIQTDVLLFNQLGK